MKESEKETEGEIFTVECVNSDIKRNVDKKNKIEFWGDDAQDKCDQLLAYFQRNRAPFDALSGVRVTEVAPGYAKGEVEISEIHGNLIGSVHGGLLFSLCDLISGVCATTRGTLITTSSGQIHFLNAAMNVKKLVAEATELKAGKNIIVVEVVIKDEKEKLISKCTMEYHTIHRSMEDIIRCS